MAETCAAICYHRRQEKAYLKRPPTNILHSTHSTHSTPPTLHAVCLCNDISIAFLSFVLLKTNKKTINNILCVGSLFLCCSSLFSRLSCAQPLGRIVSIYIAASESFQRKATLQYSSLEIANRAPDKKY